MTAGFSIRQPDSCPEVESITTDTTAPIDFGPTSLSDIVSMWHAAREIGCIKGEQRALADADRFAEARGWK